MKEIKYSKPSLQQLTSFRLLLREVLFGEDKSDIEEIIIIAGLMELAKENGYS